MDDRLPRKLAAILYADVAGYSRLTGEDEDATHRTLSEYLNLISSAIESQGGQVMHYAGDAVLAKFDAVVDAMSAAAAIQGELNTRNSDLPTDRRVEFRIGVNSGDVIEDRGDIYGDGVNVAARLESLAEPGGICISDAVRTAVGTKLDCEYHDMGEQRVKNIAGTVHAYRVAPAGQEDKPVTLRTTVDLSDQPSVAVLPFTNLSDDPQQEYFSDGITEDIITELSRFRSLVVIGRTSSFTFKGSADRVQKIAADLDVRFVVEGSVRRQGEQIRITAQLIDARRDVQVWGERYDRVLEDVFTVQDEIARAVAAAVAPEVGHAEQRRAHRKPPADLTARDLYHRGLWHLHRFTLEDLLEAESLLERAIEAEPEFAAAHSGLAYVRIQKLMYGEPDDPSEIVDAAFEVARTACALDEHDALGHFVLGRIYVRRGEYQVARHELERAIELNPSSAHSYFGLGEALVHLRKFEEALASFQTAYRLSPRDPHAWAFLHHQAWAYLGLERYEEVVAVERRALQSSTTGFWPYLPLISALGHLGKREEAKRAVDELYRLQPGYTCARARRHLTVSAFFLESIVEGMRKAGLPE